MALDLSTYPTTSRLPLVAIRESGATMHATPSESGVDRAHALTVMKTDTGAPQLRFHSPGFGYKEEGRIAPALSHRLETRNG
jgi:hypothetical protein